MVEPGLQTAFTSLAKQGNSFGQSGRTRAKWTDGLATPIRDAREEDVDWLWFVGDFASFDVRVQDATRLVARVFQAAGLDFGILYEGERNAGNDVRRAGEEGLFEMLVEHNVGQLARARFRRIVTTDPHTLNTLRHEYPQFGGEYEVWHYSQLLSALFRDGHLASRRPVGRWVTYHDPCYLARYADVMAAPREVLAAIGAWLVEMPRNGANTFCCGAGGGRIWMDDSGLRERPSEQRIREAVALGKATDFVTACPKDLTMYTAAAKATGDDRDLADPRSHRARGRGRRPAPGRGDPRDRGRSSRADRHRSGFVTTAEGLLAALADGLRRRVAERGRAEARLADFVFREGSGGRDEPAILGADRRYFVARTLAAAGELGTLDLLERLSSGRETLETLARDAPPGLDAGLATIDRIGGLAAAGLVGRDLETGRLELTGLGSAVLAFAREWERRAGEPTPADDRGPR